MFAIRSFCWLLFIDGDQLRIQSPNNLGDLALHITYIRNFASGVALWPENPIYLLSSVRYPAGIDLFNGLLLLIGVELRHGLIWVGLLASLATFYALKRWAGAFGIAAFLFNGGIAGFQLLSTGKWLDYQGDAIDRVEKHSVGHVRYAAWTALRNSCWCAFALPMARKIFSAGERFRNGPSARSAAILGRVFALRHDALVPSAHFHRAFDNTWLLVSYQQRDSPKTTPTSSRLRIVAGYLFVWLITDHFQASSVLGWKIGWVQPAASGNEFARSFFPFWFVNFGIALPLALLLLGLCVWSFWKSKPKFPLRVPTNLAFIIPAAAIFMLACLVKFAPWEWDNTKIMIWSYFMILPFLWKDLIARWPEAVRVGICIALFGSGFVSLFGGLAAGGYGFASRSEVDGVAVALKKLPVEARFAAFPTYNHPLLLNGRKVVAGYPGHLWTQGFDYSKVTDQLNALMNGAPNWRQIARQLKARYLFWGREERTNYGTSTRPWEQTMRPVASGSWGAIYDLEPTDSSASSRRAN